MGLHDNIMMTFGKFGPGADHRAIGMIPSSYLKWCTFQDWFEEKYPNLVEPFEEELAWREKWDMDFEDVEEMRY